VLIRRKINPPPDTPRRGAKRVPTEPCALSALTHPQRPAEAGQALQGGEPKKP